MTDFFSWCPITLGRWCGTQVRVHWLLVFFVLLTLLGAALGKDHRAAETAAWLALLILAVIVHELGHASMALWLGGEPEEVRLWPLGSLASPAPPSPSRWHETMWVAVAGPLTSLTLALTTAISLHMAGATMAFNPFGNPKDGTGAPLLSNGNPAVPFTMLWWIGWFGYLNWVIFLANLIPALPMDGGRVFRSVLVSPGLGHPRDSMVGPHLAAAVAILLVLFGLARLIFSEHSAGAVMVLGLALLVYITVRVEARGFEEGAFYDEGIFGYDFSEGYTSLEGSGPKVRPCRQSALKRWRQKRSALRRQRRLAREAAEEQRMDEILAKLHGQGRSALTDEEHRFLIRVSARYKGRSKAGE
jgi:stage IV sporulation protein FB